MTLRIATASDGETALLRLSGQIDEDHLVQLQAEIRRYRPRLVFDLTDATLVDRAVVQFLAAREARASNCSTARATSVNGSSRRETCDCDERARCLDSADCALVLIDFQKEMFQSIRSETGADLVELHVRLLARTAKAFNMPVVLSTSGSEPASTGRHCRRFSPSFPESP